MDGGKQDAVQDTALEAWKSINRLRNEEAAKAWFFKILKDSLHTDTKHLRWKFPDWSAGQIMLPSPYLFPYQ